LQQLSEALCFTFANVNLRSLDSSVRRRKGEEAELTVAMLRNWPLVGRKGRGGGSIAQEVKGGRERDRRSRRGEKAAATLQVEAACSGRSSGGGRRGIAVRRWRVGSKLKL